MSERYAANGVASVGAPKTLVNIYHTLATPHVRGTVYQIVVGNSEPPANVATRYIFGRTTANGTPAGTDIPANLDPTGPNGEYSAGIGHTAEPTYTTTRTLLVLPLHTSALCIWNAHDDHAALMLAAQQNHGGGLCAQETGSSQNPRGTVFFME